MVYWWKFSDKVAFRVISATIKFPISPISLQNISTTFWTFHTLQSLWCAPLTWIQRLCIFTFWITATSEKLSISTAFFHHFLTTFFSNPKALRFLIRKIRFFLNIFTLRIPTTPHKLTISAVSTHQLLTTKRTRFSDGNC